MCRDVYFTKHLLSLWTDDHPLVIHFSHTNQEKISFLEVQSLTEEQSMLASIPVDDFATLLTQPSALDALGDHFFGELRWQHVKRERRNDT